MRKPLAILLLALLPALPASRAGAATATLTVNASSSLTAFRPDRFYGNNVAYWMSDAIYQTLTAKVAATGSKYLRYPGGSSSNVYHWNGSGSYAGGLWQANRNTFSPGFEASLSYRGTTSISYGKASLLSDGNYATEWRSETNTANGANTYVYIDLGSAKTFDRSTLTWGSVYATNYTISVSTGSMPDPPYSAATNNWTLVKTISGGAGGTDTQTFTAQTARWVRIEMTASSAGAPNRDYRLAEFEVYNGATRISSHTSSASTQSLTVASPTSIQNTLAASNAWYFDFEEYMTWIKSMPAPRPDPVITVNFGTGTPEEAAAWVYYANVVKGYGIKHWEIGNEMEGSWEYGGPVNAVHYANRFIQFATAMKAEDPTIKIHGPVLGYIKTNNEIQDATAPTFLARFLKELQTQGKLALLDVINYHIYAYWANNVEATTLASPGDWTGGTANYKAFIDGLNSTYYPGSPRENMMSEYNSGADTNFTVKLPNALWLANWLGEYIKAYGTLGYAVLWDVANSLNNNGKASWGDHAYLENGSASIAAAYRYQQRAHYWAMYMLRNYFSQDGVDNSLVSASSTQSLLPVYANKRPDGHLTLLVVNKDPANAYTSTVNISGFAPAGAAGLYTFAGAATAPYYTQNYVWNDSNTANSYANPDTAPTYTAFGGASASFSFTFPAYSLTVFDLVDSNQTFTVSPTPSHSPTITPTSTPVTSLVWDDFELNQTIPAWAASADTANAATATAYVVSSAPAAVRSGARGYAASVNTGGAASWGLALLDPSPYGTGPGLGYRDMGGALYLRAYVKVSAPLQVRLAIGEAGSLASPVNGADGEQYLSNGGAWTTLSATNTWVELLFPLSGFLDDPYYPYSPSTLGNNTLNLGAIAQVSLQIKGNQGSGVSVYWDDIEFIMTAVGTPTPTPTASSTAAASPTPTRTPSPTASATPTRSPSPSATPSPTASPTGTATPSASATATASASSTPSPSASLTLSPSASLTASATPSPSFSASASYTASPSATATPSSTPSFTASASYTSSPTLSSTPTVTSSFTASPSRSPSPTLSPSSSATPSATSSPSATATPSASPSYSVSPSFSVSPTFSPGAAAPQPRPLALLPVPNPQGGEGLKLGLELQEGAEALSLQLYSPAMVLLQSEELAGPWPGGWSLLSSRLRPPSGGLYYLLAIARRDGRLYSGSPAKLYWLR